MSSNKAYKRAYESLGEERVQYVPRDRIAKEESATSRSSRDKKAKTQGTAAVEQYWDTRVDESWSKIPGFFE